MQHFHVATYDQILVVNGKQLSSYQNNCTLAELKIEPYSVIVLRVSVSILIITMRKCATIHACHLMVHLPLACPLLMIFPHISSKPPPPPPPTRN